MQSKMNVYNDTKQSIGKQAMQPCPRPDATASMQVGKAANAACGAMADKVNTLTP